MRRCRRETVVVGVYGEVSQGDFSSRCGNGDEDLARVALREAIEETGIGTLALVEPAIDLDIHLVNPPDEDPHEHYDTRFLALAPSDVRIVRNHESEELRWVSPKDLPNLGGVDDLYPLVQKGIDRLQELSKKIF